MSNKKKKSKKYLEDYNYKNTVEDSEEGNGSYDDCFFIGTATSSNDENHEDNGEDTEVEHQAIENEDDSENESDSSDGPLIIDINLGNEDENYEDDGEDTEEEHQAIDNKDASENESDSSDGPLIIDINLGNEDENYVEDSQIATKFGVDLSEKYIDGPIIIDTGTGSDDENYDETAEEDKQATTVTTSPDFIKKIISVLEATLENQSPTNTPSSDHRYAKAAPPFGSPTNPWTDCKHKTDELRRAKRSDNIEDDISYKDFALSEFFKTRVPVLNFKGELYVFTEERGYYQKWDERAVSSRIKALLDRNARYGVSIRNYKDTYEQLLRDESIAIEEETCYNKCVLFDNGAYNILSGDKVMGPPHEFYRYKVNATYKRKTENTPVFDAFLESVSGGDYEIKRRIREFIGYCLLPDLEGKCFFVLGTASDSGKSVLARFFKKLFGKDVISNVSLEEFGQQFALAPIVGKHLNLAMDLPDELLTTRDVSRLKQLTGEDDISMQEKYMKAFSHTNTAKFVFATNQPLMLKKDNEAFWKRLIIVPFIVSIPKEEQNKHLLDDLWAERDGIVSQAIEAVKVVINKEYAFSDCIVAEQMKNQWRWHEIADVLNFIRECCDFTDKCARTTVSELYTSYCNFCDKNDIEEREMKGFSQTLKKHFNLKSFKGEYKSHHMRGYKGIKLKSQD